MTRNIAISNGSNCGIPQNFNPTDTLFSLKGTGKTSVLTDILLELLNPLGDFAFISLAILFDEPGLLIGILPGNSKFDIDFYAKALPNVGQETQIYKGKLTFTKKLLWLINIKVNLTNKSYNNPNNILPFDYYPGGNYIIPLNFPSTSINGLFGSFTLNSTIISSFNFIPTPSSLDVGNGNTTLNNSDYLRNYSITNPPVGEKAIPFQNYITAFENGSGNNEQHITFNTRNGNWLAEELDNDNNSFPVSNCSFLCNNTGISGADIICTGDVRFSVGNGASSYKWTIKNQQNVNIKSGLNSSYLILSKKSGKSGYITLNVEIDGGDCGTSIQEKEVYVGGPKFKNVQEVNISQINHLMPYSSGGCGDFGLKLNFEPNNNNVQQIEWRKITNNFQWSQENNANPDEYVIISPYCNELIQFEVRAKNECGWSGWQRVVYNATICNNNCSSSGNTSGINSTNFDVFPVPASSNLTVKVKNVAPSILMNGEIFKITLYNKVYRITKRVNGIANSISTNVSSLPTGSYILTIQYNSIYESHTILID